MFDQELLKEYVSNTITFKDVKVTYVELSNNYLPNDDCLLLNVYYLDPNSVLQGTLSFLIIEVSNYKLFLRNKKIIKILNEKENRQYIC